MAAEQYDDLPELPNDLPWDQEPSSFDSDSSHLPQDDREKVKRTNPIQHIVNNKQPSLIRAPETFQTLAEYEWNKAIGIGIQSNSVSQGREYLDFLISLGFDLLPTVPRSKKLKSGITRTATALPSDFESTDNVSIRLGYYDKGPLKGHFLFDLDLETRRSQDVTALYMRHFGIETPCYGRISAPRNHYIFLIKDEDGSSHHIKTKQFFTTVNDEESKDHTRELLLFEGKPSGHALIPKSWHPSDGIPEQLLWMSNCTTIASFGWKEIQEHCHRISAICNLVDFFVEGNRNNFVFAFSSWCAKESLPFDALNKILHILFDYSNTNYTDKQQLFATAVTVYNKYQNSAPSEKIKFGGINAFLDKVSSNVGISLANKLVEKVRDTLFFDSSQAYAGESVIIDRLNREFYMYVSGKIYRYKYIYEGERRVGIDAIPLDVSGFSNLVNTGLKTYLVHDGKTEEGKDKFKRVYLSEFWKQHPNRLSVHEDVFDPQVPPGFFDHVYLDTGDKVKKLNRWFGWPIVPIKHNWDTIRDYLFRIICDSDAERYKWLLDLFAFKIQNPHKLSEVCLILYGEQRTGKSFFTDAFCTRLFGIHNCKTTGKVSELLGQFNNDYARKMMVTFHEVLSPTRRERIPISEKMKDFITNKTIAIEGKGIDRLDMPSYVQVFITTNNYRNVPIGDDRRRYCIYKIGTAEKDNTIYFDNLARSLRTHEINGFMHYLLYQHNLCGESVYEELTNEDLIQVNEEALKSRNPAAIFYSFFSERDQRTEIQFQHLHRTLPVTEQLVEMHEDPINDVVLNPTESLIQHCIENALLFGYFNCKKFHPELDKSIAFSAADLRVQYYEYDRKFFDPYSRSELSRLIRGVVTRLFAKPSQGNKTYSLFRTETTSDPIYNGAFIVKKGALNGHTLDVKYMKKYECLFDDNTFIITNRHRLYKYLNRKEVKPDVLEMLDRIFNENAPVVDVDNDTEIVTFDQIGRHIHGDTKWLEIKTKSSEVF